MNANMNHCPYCGEVIKPKVQECPYCGEALNVRILTGKALFKEVRRIFSDRFDVLGEQYSSGICIGYKVVTRTDEVPYLLRIQHPYLQADADQAQRFERSNRILKQLNHKHILEVTEYGQLGGISYAISPFLEVTDLGTVLSSSSGFGKEECIRLLSQLGDALSYAHSNGVVHGGLRPERILYSDAGQIYVSGFGYDGQGTFRECLEELSAYVSPEQALGLSFDKRSDIYGLGVLLYVCLTGCIAPELDDSRIILSSYHSGQTIYSLIRRDGEIKEFDKVLKRALSYNAKQRYADAMNLVKELKNAKRVNPICPICGKRSHEMRFKCEECGRDNICQSHMIKDGLCTECKESMDRKERSENLARLKRSMILKEYVKQRKGRTDSIELQQYLERRGYLPIEEDGLADLVKEIENAYREDVEKRIKIIKAVGIGIVIILLIIKFVTMVSNFHRSFVPLSGSGVSSGISKKTRDSEKEREEKITHLYEQALEYIRKNRLTSPAGACAYDVADELAGYDRSKSNAIKIKIAEKYKQWGTYNYNNGNYQKALRYFNKAYSIDGSTFSGK